MMQLTLNSASVAFRASIEHPTFNIINFAYEELLKMPEFEHFNNIVDDNGQRYSPIYPSSLYQAGAVGLTYLDPMTNPEMVSIVYDDFIKSRSGGMKYFYPIKSIQARVKISTNDIGRTILLRNRFVEIIDREDAAAEEVNAWYAEKYPLTNNDTSRRLSFHCINAYQTAYMADATNMDDQRNVFSGDIIIKADYHINGSYN